jgi:hypothetical protein
MLAKERDRPLDVLSLPLEASEHAARDRATTAVNEQIGVAERSEMVVEGDPTTIGHFGIEQIADRNRIGSARTNSEHRGAVDRLDAIDATHFDSGCNGLIQERRVQRSRIPSAPNEVIERPLASNIVAVVDCVESSPIDHGVVLERDLDPCSTQLIEYILVVTPVLKALEVAVKARTDLPVPLPNNDIATASGKRNGASKAGRSGSDDRNGIAWCATCTRAALKSTHRRSSWIEDIGSWSVAEKRVTAAQGASWRRRDFPCSLQFRNETNASPYVYGSERPKTLIQIRSRKGG